MAKFVLELSTNSFDKFDSMLFWSLDKELQGKCPIPEEGGPELCSRAEIMRLFKVLQENLDVFLTSSFFRFCFLVSLFLHLFIYCGTSWLKRILEM